MKSSTSRSLVKKVYKRGKLFGKHAGAVVICKKPSKPSASQMKLSL